MGVSFLERHEKVVRNKVGGIWRGSSNRFEDRYHSRVAVSTKSIESQAFGVPAPRIFSQTCSILWIVYAIHLTGVFAIFDKTSDIKVKIKVPNEAKMGSSVELECEWHLYGPSGLYSVKWYKDDHEFFRYIPEDNPRIQTFPQPGIKIDNGWNNEKSIRLNDLEARSSGQYKCEVSTEAPSFATIYQTANLTVIALPERGPEITGLSSYYTIGDNVTANCTVWPSIPKAVVIRWLVNGKPIANQKTIRYSSITKKKKKKKQKEMETPNAVGLQVKLKLEPSHFHDTGEKSAIAIKCIAEFGSNLVETESRVPVVYSGAYANPRSKGRRSHRVYPGQRVSLLLLCYFSSRLRMNEQI
ncbi:uncharacterized protein LOC143306091 [Osmia lignaria lignaria]|uniref:uncharacterized protein LOC143306091 n=1 Tax=Osmia lignaria lignaria TaxID=1437193 RepID=UPI00402BE9FB